jgi:hypothetical protein
MPRGRLAAIAGVFALFTACKEDTGTAPLGASSGESGSAKSPAATPARQGEAPSREPGAGAEQPKTDESGPKPGPVRMPDPPVPPTARPDASGPTATLAIFDDYGLPVYAALTHLCARRELRTAGQITVWDAFASDDAPARIIEHYNKRLGEPGFAAKDEGGTWSLPPGSPVPNRKLSVYASNRSGRHQACKNKPGPDTKAVIVISREE